MKFEAFPASCLLFFLFFSFLPRLFFIFRNTQHLAFALPNPFVKKKVGEFEIFFAILKAPHHDISQKMGPVRNALN